MTDAAVGREVTLVFFDIDGTILNSGGAGKRAFIRTLRHVFGWDDDIAYINFAGATDLAVLDIIAERQAHALTDEERKAFFDRMAVELQAAVREVDPVAFPGTRELVEELAGDDRYLVGLVTGNEERCARIKLACFHLHGHFLLGAFGCEHADRMQIARLARERAEQRLAPHLRPGRSFLIGDTPNDVTAAHAIGAEAIAVATGFYDREALEQAGAEYVFEDLGDRQAVARVLGLAQ